jgi:hypothetical protein
VRELIQRNAGVWLCRYLIPGQCVFRLAVSPLVRVWMDPASGALIHSVVDGLPVAVAATVTFQQTHSAAYHREEVGHTASSKCLCRMPLS